MATTGQVYPTLGETISESPWLDNTWTTPTNIYSDNAATANVTATSFDNPDQTFVLKATGFNFSMIPDGSTINGVTCRVNAWYRSGQGAGSVDLLQLLDTSKARVGTNQCLTAVALTTTDTTIITKGGVADLWGNALTAAWVKSANFGVGLGILATAANADVDVDYITLEIEYTPPPGTTVAATSVGLVLTKYAANVALDVSIPTNVRSLAIVKYAAIVDVVISVSAGFSSLALSTYSAAVSIDSNILASTNSLILTTISSIVSVDIEVNTNVKTFSLVTYGCDVQTDDNVNVLAGTSSLSISEYSALVSVDSNILCNICTMSLTLHNASVDTGIVPIVTKFVVMLTPKLGIVIE